MNILNTKYPLLLAPMAGGFNTVSLVSAVCQAGGMGAFGMAYLTPQQMQQEVDALRLKTDKPFCINLFLHQRLPPQKTKITKTLAHLKPIREKFGLDIAPKIPERISLSHQFEMLLKLKPAVFSSTFNPPSKEMIFECHKLGIKVAGTATTLDEALHLQELKLDAITLQGIEAGGHRGTFLHPIEEAQVGLFGLLESAKGKITTPLIAAGGIMSKQGVQAALQLGASAVQMGTAFLTTNEAGTPQAHRDMLLNSHAPTVLSSVYTGRHARGIKNALYEFNQPLNNKTPDFDTMNALTRDIRTASNQAGDAQYMSLWAGQAYQQCKKQSAEELILSLF